MDLLMEAMEKHWDAHDGIPCMHLQIVDEDSTTHVEQYVCLVCSEIISVGTKDRSKWWLK